MKEGSMSPRARLTLLRLAGVSRLVLGALHLAVTPFIVRFIRLSAAPDAVEWLLPPMILNHVVLGVLLLPLGGLTLYSARPASEGTAWALTVSRAIAVTVVTLPPILFALMGRRYFTAKPFLLATAIACLASLTLLLAAFWPAPASPRSR
jgi:hypothetical protein